MSHLNTRPSHEDVITSPQDITASWVDLGSEILVDGYTNLGLWVKLIINDSVNVRLKVLAKQTESATDEFEVPIKTIGSTSIDLNTPYYEFDADVDQNMLLEVDTGGYVGFIQIQVQAEIIGATAAQIESLSVSKIWR